MRACCSRTHATHLSPARAYILMYTSVHLPPQRYTAIPCGRTLGSPGRRPYTEEATLFFFSSSFAGPTPADLPFSFSIREHLVERAAPSNQVSKSRLFQKGAPESRRSSAFFVIEDRGSTA
ncbi:hypothetical protein ALC56_07935 [Trachymyrmex septentrionalis]|uniref:Uncharacterized protein n=1 Tax=Trachymyrmex septentrionalis TaxID=34720 RepID=A0A195FBI4_9HYME|nr:hypothetical protein ALC56_07935 [Trachymyrmex septentrionalis]